MEHIKAELERLYRRLYEMDKEYDKKKGIRQLLAILLFAAPKLLLIFVLVYQGSIEVIFKNIEVLLGFVGFLAITIFYSFIEYWIWFTIFNHHFTKCDEELSHLNHIRKEIAEVKKELEQEQRKGR